MSYPLPKNEEARLQTLRDYNILDTGEEKVFDDVTFIASTVCETPVSIIALIDKDRQWFKSAHGVPHRATPRELAFCNYTILQKKPLVVPDLREDARHSSNPLVTNAPHVRFYAGAPLITPGGFVLGTVCVVDIKPRELNADQVKALEYQARQVMTQLELRRVSKSLEAETVHLRKLEGLLPVCSHCHGLREDTDYWTKVDAYTTDNPAAVARQGCCKACAKKIETEMLLKSSLKAANNPQQPV
jgi:GAF domain-containing protein